MRLINIGMGLMFVLMFLSCVLGTYVITLTVGSTTCTAKPSIDTPEKANDSDGANLDIECVLPPMTMNAGIMMVFFSGMLYIKTIKLNENGAKTFFL